MRIGLMVGPERGRFTPRRSTASAPTPGGPRRPGFASIWVPQIPDEVRRLHDGHPRRHRDQPHRDQHRRHPGPAAHPIALALQQLSVQAVLQGRLALGHRRVHHWIVDEMLGLPYERPAARCAPTSTCSTRRSAGDGAGSVDVENDLFRRAQPDGRHRHRPDPGADRRPRADHAAASPASGPTARSSGWPTSGRSAPTWSRTSPRRPRRAGRPAPALVAGRARLRVRRRPDRGRDRSHQPRALRGRGLAELPEAPRPRRRPGRRRPPRRRRASRPSRSASAPSPTHGVTDLLRPRRADRRRPRPAHRLPRPHPRLPRVARGLALIRLPRRNHDRHPPSTSRSSTPTTTSTRPGTP